MSTIATTPTTITKGIEAAELGAAAAPVKSRIRSICFVIVAMSRLRRESSRQSVITVELIQFIIQYRAKETQEKKKRCESTT